MANIAQTRGLRSSSTDVAYIYIWGDICAQGREHEPIYYRTRAQFGAEALLTLHTRAAEHTCAMRATAPSRVESTTLVYTSALATRTHCTLLRLACLTQFGSTARNLLIGQIEEQLVHHMEQYFQMSNTELLHKQP